MTNLCSEIVLRMIGDVIAMHQIPSGVWYVMWDLLGYSDYKSTIAPWCEANLEGEFKFVASASVECSTEADALMLYMRFK
jgi:hypothetical protein